MNASQESRSFSSPIRRALTAAMLSCFALAAWFWSQEFSPGHDHAAAATVSKPASRPTASTAVPTSSNAARSTTNSDVRYVTKNIEDVPLGQRLLGRNPLRHETSAPSDIDPATWRTIRLTMNKHDVVYELVFLRSLAWLADAKAVAGGTIQLHLPELGLDGDAFVESIASCPTIEPDDSSGRMVVTGTMKHFATNVLNLTIAGLDEPLGVTTTHPIWSEDRQAFVPAGQLVAGENLRQADGKSIQLTRITPKRGPPEVVYNLEVDGEHVYHVADRGLLIHNSCPSFFDGTHYTDKVLTQMQRGPGELHSFPEIVKRFESDGTVRDLVGGDGITRKLLEIPGSYTTTNGRAVDGAFQFLKESDGTINHRLFLPKILAGQ